MLLQDHATRDVRPCPARHDFGAGAAGPDEPLAVGADRQVVQGVAGRRLGQGAVRCGRPHGRGDAVRVHWLRCVSALGSAALCSWPPLTRQLVALHPNPPTGLKYNGKRLVAPTNGSAAYFADASTLGMEQGVSFAPAQGPALEPDQPFNILTGAGDLVRVDDSATSAYLSPGNGSLPSEQFRAYDPLDPASPALLKPGATAIIRSEVGWAGALCQASRCTVACG